MKKLVKWIIVLLVAALAVWGGWQLFKPEEKAVYLTETVKRGEIRRTVRATGEISAGQLVDVGAQASGQIKKLYVKLGQTVKKGDLIAEIDSTTQVNALSSNQAKLETFRAQLASARIALGNAERAYRRERALWSENATSKAELEDAEGALASAKAKITELQSQIKQTQIAINTAEADLGYTRISAPMDGTVVSVTVEEGQTVNANQTAPTIIQLADLTVMLNKMQIAEGDVTKVKAGQKVSFTILSEPDTPVEAVLDTVDPGLTILSQGSYSKKTDTTDTAVYYYARALVPNRDGQLSIGMTTQNTIEISRADQVLAVPNLAVKKRGGKSFVRVVGEDGKAVEREIQTGLRDSMNIEVKSGLKEGEKVVVSENMPSENNDQRRMPPM
ncbi:efflux RND transporter periplasmic adaptor subunit [Neisseria weaveri]|uniref:efflux RND transporter periplasmic adaptor subunit n=1 Tax=Neisseria weaveri TaxID=28091 RepID=UPI000D317871|nr:efflux RND transporter periplasmic adaptor subunit [Neisseria weaveri]